MPSTVGPLFALQGRFESEFSQQPWTSPTQAVFESRGGAFYTLEISSSALREKIRDDQEMKVFVVQIIREDAESLYAFESLIERALFLEIREFDSVGPKTAALLLASLGVSGVRDLLERGQAPSGKIPGLGPKTMEKILSGLKQNKDVFLQLFAKDPGFKGSNFKKFSQSMERNLSSSDQAPLAIVQAMEKLGLRVQDVQILWTDLSQEHEGFAKLPEVEILRHLLQAWGRSKNRSLYGVGMES